KKNKIKSHLSRSPYSIYQKRKTTINNAFASAIAPMDEYDGAIMGVALQLLGQDPDGDLKCVYCGSDAETWDHLIGLVKKGELHGYGHQLGNLVPCCKKCNSEKGGKDWEDYLREKLPDPSAFAEKRGRIASYRDRYAALVNLEHAKKQSPDDWALYGQINDEILMLMKKADVVAARLRDTIRQSFEKQKPVGGWPE
ncbi:MAG TPA: HNH endonuclease signature motif containing protein, partial [Acidobacteriaceae bacterium]|nr:HNH endonuclease signature motif containing protein [Acidobacteriaceae bacterium]